MRPILLSLLLASGIAANAQWELQNSKTKANLRGVHAVSESVAWASGTDGTILRTIDGGAQWTRCAVPPDAGKLDFRGIWAWDADKAYILSSGPGELSRVYATTDGCVTWTELNRNHDPDGFWDAMTFRLDSTGQYTAERAGVLLGDPVKGHFYVAKQLYGRGFRINDDFSCAPKPDEAAFAASNSSVVMFPLQVIVGTGGKGGPRVLISVPMMQGDSCTAVPVPIAGGSDSTGVFALGFRSTQIGIAVGGDYKKPAETSSTAAWTTDGGRHWTAATKMPNGYRSAVAWDPQHQVWIAAGTTGSDISRDDGKTWTPLDEGEWNALSLPFVVGPNGRIAKLAPKALPTTSR